ncbi:MAG: glutamate racemase [Bacteroidales bacterium]|nr:glutamate racemase [Bacteroidales bacterium]
MCIGVFDSGVGGLSVWREIIKVLPGTSVTYFSDGAYCPYGNRSQKEIIDRAYLITDFLLSKGAGIIVVACNTATAAAIKALREKYRIPFIGMEPAVKPAALHSKSGTIGVLATRGTLNGNHFHASVERFASDVNVVAKVGEGLVELVESGETSGSKVKELLKSYINPMLEQGADHIVLGCTHYPFLLESIKEVAGDSVVIVDPAPAIALRTLNVIRENNILVSEMVAKDGYPTTFYTTASTGALMMMARRIDSEIPEQNFKKIEI